MLQLEKERKAREEREKRDAEEAAERQRREEEWVRRNHGNSIARAFSVSSHQNFGTFILALSALESRQKPAGVCEQTEGRGRIHVNSSFHLITSKLG